MAVGHPNSVWFVAGSSGTADFDDGTALPGYRNMATAALTNGDVFSYRAKHPTIDTVYENGRGTYNSGSGLLERTTQYETSNGGSKVDFAVPPVIALVPLEVDLEEILSNLGDAWGDSVDADIIPDADGTRDLGSTGTRFKAAYFDSLTVTGNIVLAGTVDGRDIAADGAILDTRAPLASPTFSGTVTVPDGSFSYGKLASAAIASAADIKAGTANKLLTAAEIWNAADDVEALSNTTTVAVDMDDIMALSSVTITANRTLGNPSNVKEGQAWGMAITASGGARTMAKGSNYKGDGGATWPLSIASGETAYVFFENWSSSITLITGVFNNPT